LVDPVMRAPTDPETSEKNLNKYSNINELKRYIHVK